MVRRAALAGILVLLAVALSAPSAAAQSPKLGGVLRIADREAPNLDPHLSVSFLTHSWSNMIYSQLVRYVHGPEQKHPADFTVVPDLAEKWEHQGPTVIVFTLRKGVKFHNGDPLTAEDAKFSFHRAKGKLLHEKVKEVVVVDPLRLRFVLKEPWPDFLSFYGTLVSGAAWVVPKKYVEQVGDDGFRKRPIGLGPYKFVSQTPGVEVVLEANESYWRKMPSVKRLVFKSVPEALAHFEAEGMFAPGNLFGH